MLKISRLGNSSVSAGIAAYPQKPWIPVSLTLSSGGVTYGNVVANRNVRYGDLIGMASGHACGFDIDFIDVALKTRAPVSELIVQAGELGASSVRLPREIANAERYLGCVRPDIGDLIQGYAIDRFDPDSPVRLVITDMKNELGSVVADRNLPFLNEHSHLVRSKGFAFSLADFPPHLYPDVYVVFPDGVILSGGNARNRVSGSRSQKPFISRYGSIVS